MSLMSRIGNAVLIPFVLVATPVRAEVTDAQVRDAIRRGVDFLKKEQKADGSWAGHPGYPGGVTALCTLALLNGGLDIDDPVIQRGLTYLRSVGEPQMVYSTALQTMVFAVATPDEDRLLISRNVQWLENVQIKSGSRQGAWKYSDGRGSGDNSNTQFALLALYEADRIGIRVRPDTWKLALDYWLRTQNLDGSWSYFPGQSPTGSMTCAGLASVLIAKARTGAGDASVVNGEVQCCGSQDDDQSLERAFRWLASKFSVRRNPNPVNNQAWLYYYLYGVERVGRLSGRRFIGSHDWYREGAEFLVSQQDLIAGSWRGSFLAEENALLASSFALLFLSKGRRPTVIAKLKYTEGAAWDRHRHAVQNLTQRIEQAWERDLTWQTIDLSTATPQDLLESPVLFMSGADGFRLTSGQKQNLQQFVAGGGFLFAEASCEGRAFDRDFRALMKELFPGSPLRVLPPDHPVWFAEQRIDPGGLRPLYGIEACCRTSVVYCPTDLACYWELDGGGRDDAYPAAVQSDVRACRQIGLNVITYATNRELKNKLDRPLLGRGGTTEQPRRGVLYLPKVLHSGGGDDAPNALPNLLSFLAAEAGLRVGVENRLIACSDPELYEYPLLFMHGRRDFRLTEAERATLRTFFERGGLLFADAICGSPEFLQAFRREMQLVLAGAAFARIPPEHPLFSREYGGFDLRTVTVRDPQLRSPEDPFRATLKQVSPQLEAITLEERLAVVLSPYDISCALENGVSLECRSYVREDAARLGLNVILYGLQQ